MIKKKEKVVCAMSGGVDSSVAAFLLKKQGYEVVGIHLKLVDQTLVGKSFREDEERAKKVAKILKIPLHILDLRKIFYKEIIQRFILEVKKGYTPNPCVYCNKQIKFGVLLQKALSLGGNFLATGHYARKERLKNKNAFRLLKAKDKKKDQSYFLWKLNQEQLKKIIFPLGDLDREEVEQIAKKNKLPVLERRKSVELCFVPDKMEDFLKENIGVKKGKILDDKGRFLGWHNGVWFYTLGQRKGIKLAGGPYYVLEKNIKENVLIVTKDKEKIYKKNFYVRQVNWILPSKINFPLKVKTRVRYRQKEQFSLLTEENGKLKVVFLGSGQVVVPGQSAVFYQGKELLGGGVID